MKYTFQNPKEAAKEVELLQYQLIATEILENACDRATDKSTDEIVELYKKYFLPSIIEVIQIRKHANDYAIWKLINDPVRRKQKLEELIERLEGKKGSKGSETTKTGMAM